MQLINISFSGIKKIIEIGKEIKEKEEIEKERLDKRIFSIDKDIYDLGERIGGFKNEIKTLKQRQEELRKKIDDSRRYSEKDTKTQNLIAKLKVFIKDFKVTTKKKLEEKMDLI